jgi:hypothetical protein
MRRCKHSKRAGRSSDRTTRAPAMFPTRKTTLCSKTSHAYASVKLNNSIQHLISWCLDLYGAFRHVTLIRIYCISFPWLFTAVTIKLHIFPSDESIQRPINLAHFQLFHVSYIIKHYFIYYYMSSQTSWPQNPLNNTHFADSESQWKVQFCTLLQVPTRLYGGSRNLNSLQSLHTCSKL